MNEKLFMLLLGCRPAGRNTEQHDVFFGIGETLKDLIPQIKKCWAEAKGNIHIDAWRQVTLVNGWNISVQPIKSTRPAHKKNHDLFFINLGGYRENEFDEFHYKMLVVAMGLEQAKNEAKKTAFFKHHSIVKAPNYPNATAHIDDKFGIDVDDAYKLEDILLAEFKTKYRLEIAAAPKGNPADELHLGYLRLADL